MDETKTMIPRWPSWVTTLLGTALLGLTAGASVYGLRACSSAGSNESNTTARSVTPSALEPAHIEIPEFGRPEEAERYFDAMTAGDRRSLQLLDQALTEARSSPNAEPSYLAELERERNLRAARLRAYENARNAGVRSARNP
jgi:hypothetical protein